MRFAPFREALFLGILACAAGSNSSRIEAHELTGHTGPTYEVTPPADFSAETPRIYLDVYDRETGEPVAARFSLTFDSSGYDPPALCRNGLRFVTIHLGKKQRFAVCYTRGTGTVQVPLPDGVRSGVVTVVKGYEYLPEQVPFEVVGKETRIRVGLKQWTETSLHEWLAADTHLHYERTDPRLDSDWLTILDADGLRHGHFLVLKGGNLDGVWSTQFAYGKEGEASDGARLIRPGEEYRDRSQGHINLLGISEIIQPISTGGMGVPSVPFNFPPFYDVLRRARELGGVGGPAHGTALGQMPTGILDAVLGAVDFFEIANTHLHFFEPWYHLMNCGFIIPPTGGTDLPNFPHRDSWQPLFGETRTYLKLGSAIDFSSWKKALQRGEVFVTSGPMVSFTVNGSGPGSTVHLPESGGEILIEATLSSPRPLKLLELVRNGLPLKSPVSSIEKGSVHTLRIEQKFQVSESCWLAARGEGVVKESLKENSDILKNTMAHTGAVKVIVGSQRIWSKASAEWLLSELNKHKGHYQNKASFQTIEDREYFLALYDRAIRLLAGTPTDRTSQ